MDPAIWPAIPRTWSKKKQLGRGSAAVVLQLSKDPRSDARFALKIFLFEDPQIESELEVVTMLGFKSPHVIPFRGSYSTKFDKKNRKCLLFDEMKLNYKTAVTQSFLLYGTPPTLEYMKSLVGTALAGLQFIHKQGIVHRDIKPDNLYIGGKDSAKPFVVYGDFGYACIPAQEGACNRLLGSMGYFSKETCAAYLIRRPLTEVELVDEDMFALGATLYFAANNMLPYQFILNRFKEFADSREKQVLQLQAVLNDYTGVARPLYYDPVVDEVIGNLIDPYAGNRQSIAHLLAMLKFTLPEL